MCGPDLNGVNKDGGNCDEVLQATVTRSHCRSVTDKSGRLIEVLMMNGREARLVTD